MSNTTRAALHVIVSLGLLVAFTSLANADVMITSKTHTEAFEMAGQKTPASDETIVTWLSESKARMDQGDTASWIIHTEDETVTMLDHRNKTFMEIQLGEGGIEGMAMPGMEAAMEGMSPEEAEQMQKMMGGMMKQMMQLKVEVTETGDEKKIKDWTCERYVVNTEVGASVSSAETWATEDIAVDFELFNAISRAFMSIMPGYEAALEEMSKVKGVTVYSENTTQVMGATIKSTTELLEYKNADAPEGAFDVPEDYEEAEM
jgi:hypothetical protein